MFLIMELQRKLKCAMVLLMIVTMELVYASHIKFGTEPQDTVIVYGDDVFLSCDAYNVTSGTSEDLKFSWRFQGNSAPSSSSMFANHTLLLPRVTEADIGNYTCLVTDDVTGEEVESSPALVFHAFIKMFELSPVTVNAMEDDVVTLQCITGESAPPPEVFWEHDGVIFTGARQFTATYGGSGLLSEVRQFSMMLVLVAKPHLDGMYNCVSRNPRLNIEVRSLKARLKTTERESAPYVIQENVVTEVVGAYNQALLLDCPIGGKPRVSVVWYKDGVKIQNSQSFLVLQNASIHTPAAKLSDAGEYFCIGFNEHGEIHSPNITVIVAKLDMTFQKPPDDLYVIAGRPATLHCIPPVSVPIATVTWYKDDKLLVPRSGEQSVIVQRTSQNSWDVVFNEIQEADEGQYFCVATNQYAVPSTRTSRVAVVEVGGAPAFTQPPTGLTVHKGSLAQLLCYVSGDPFPAVTWLFEDRDLIASETVSFREQNQVLMIGNIHKGYEGTYTCKATNRYGNIQTKVYIKVLVPPVVLQPIGNVTVSAGDPGIIPCAVYSDPLPTVTWFKDGISVSLGKRLTQLQDGLYINTVLPEDSGSYMCQASNEAGSIQTTGTLIVQILPHFEVRPISQTVTMGFNATLTCVANGYPKPDITWLYNGSTLFPTDVLLSLDKQNLLLMDTDWSHVGEYRCQAQNIEGFAATSAFIKLQIPPEIEKIEGIPILYKGENLHLTCVVNGMPDPVIEWQHNRVPIQVSQDGRITLPNTNSLLVKFTTLEDAGRYTCKVTNTAGVSEKSLEVYIIVRPSAPVLTDAEVMSAVAVRLTWTLEQLRPQTPVNHVIVYFRKKTDPVFQTYPREVSSTRSKFTISDLQPATEYLVTVTAVNDAGESDRSNILAVVTYDAGPSEPRNLEASVIQAYNITLIWEIPLVTNGEIRRYRVLYKERDDDDYRGEIIPSSGAAGETHILRNLTPYTRYSIQVQAATMQDDRTLWGNMTDTLEVKTAQSAPTGSPQETQAYPVSSAVIQVMWEAVSQEKQHGPIKRYYIKYWLLSDMSLLGELVSESLDLKLNISDLHPWTWYEFQVVAENDAGRGIPGEQVRARTLPVAPTGSPVDVSAVSSSATTVTVSWKLPLVSERNSELSGILLNYWKTGETIPIAVTLNDVTVMSYTVKELVPWSEYVVRVAAFTNQVEPGIGPYSGNVSVRTQESEPGPISYIQMASTATTIMLSWQPPVTPNGIVTEYFISYFSAGSLVDDNAKGQETRMATIAAAILNNTDIMSDIFKEFSGNVTEEDIRKIVQFCGNYTKTDNDLTELQGVSDAMRQWVVDLEKVTLQEVCSQIQSVELDLTRHMSSFISQSAEEGPTVFNLTSRSQQVTLVELDPFTSYNISVSAVTAAGRGEPVSVMAATVKAASTSRPTSPVTTTTTTADTATVLAERADNPVNVPVFVGGGVAGLVAILFVLLIAVCVFLRRRRRYEDEKTHVIQEESSDNMYREFDKYRSDQMAAPTDDSIDTDSRLSTVDIYSNAVRYGRSHQRQEYGARGNQPFMTSRSGQPHALENPNFVDFNPAEAMKNNPIHLNEPGTSDQESVTVSMALSDEDMPTQGENTLKRKNHMKSSDAAAIARLRHSTLPHEISRDTLRALSGFGSSPLPLDNNVLPSGVTERDTSSLIDNDAEVIYNERTAL